MLTDRDGPTLLTIGMTDQEATLIVHYLADEGLKATFAGPEARGDVQVVVCHADLWRAKERLDAVRQRSRPR